MEIHIITEQHHADLVFIDIEGNAIHIARKPEQFVKARATLFNCLTGVLAPTIGRDDRNGLDLKLPVYLNLAPNYDATITPHWYSKRGLMLEGEFRYLTARSTGIFTGTYLPGDDQALLCIRLMAEPGEH